MSGSSILTSNGSRHAAAIHTVPTNGSDSVMRYNIKSTPVGYIPSNPSPETLLASYDRFIHPTVSWNEAVETKSVSPDIGIKVTRQTLNPRQL